MLAATLPPIHLALARHEVGERGRCHLSANDSVKPTRGCLAGEVNDCKSMTMALSPNGPNRGRASGVPVPPNADPEGGCQGVGYRTLLVSEGW